jgi:hypothetical protein
MTWPAWIIIPPCALVALVAVLTVVKPESGTALARVLNALAGCLTALLPWSGATRPASMALCASTRTPSPSSCECQCKTCRTPSETPAV